MCHETLTSGTSISKNVVFQKSIYAGGRTPRRLVLGLITTHLTIRMIFTHLAIRLSNAPLCSVVFKSEKAQNEKVFFQENKLGFDIDILR